MSDWFDGEVSSDFVVCGIQAVARHNSAVLRRYQLDDAGFVGVKF